MPKTKKTKKPGRTYITTSVSILPELEQKAKKKAKTLKRSMSNYVQVLIEKDLEGDKEPAAT